MTEHAEIFLLKYNVAKTINGQTVLRNDLLGERISDKASSEFQGNALIDT